LALISNICNLDKDTIELGMDWVKKLVYNRIVTKFVSRDRVVGMGPLSKL